MQIEMVEPGKLVLAPYNPRTIEDEALRRLVVLLDTYGFVDPIIARREDGLVIGGHQRLRANGMRETPDATVPVVFLDGLTDAKAMALNVALNNPAAMGEFSIAKLAGVLNEIDTGEFDVPDFTAFSLDEIAKLMHGVDDSNFEPIDQAPPRLDQKQPVTCPSCGHVF